MRRLVDHTADVAIEAEGDGPGACLAEAALALTELLAGRPPHTLEPEREQHLRVEAPDAGALAVAFLSELVWLLESQDLLWLGGGVEVFQQGPLWVAQAAGNAVRHEAARHGRGVEVKAVTYHDLLFERRGARWSLRVVLDL